MVAQAEGPADVTASVPAQTIGGDPSLFVAATTILDLSSSVPLTVVPTATVSASETSSVAQISVSEAAAAALTSVFGTPSPVQSPTPTITTTVHTSIAESISIVHTPFVEATIITTSSSDVVAAFVPSTSVPSLTRDDEESTLVAEEEHMDYSGSDHADEQSPVSQMGSPGFNEAVQIDPIMTSITACISTSTITSTTIASIPLASSPQVSISSEEYYQNLFEVDPTYPYSLGFSDQGFGGASIGTTSLLTSQPTDLTQPSLTVTLTEGSLPNV